MSMRALLLLILLALGEYQLLFRVIFPLPELDMGPGLLGVVVVILVSNT